jgi:hypothetical protein
MVTNVGRPFEPAIADRSNFNATITFQGTIALLIQLSVITRSQNLVPRGDLKLIQLIRREKKIFRGLNNGPGGHLSSFGT